MGFQTNIPIYVQIANQIKEQIISGKLKDGDKLCSVREYSVIYQVTALTIQRALQLLETEGIIRSKKGVGSFVASDIRNALENKMVSGQVGDFIAKMKNMGLKNDDILKLVKEGLNKNE